MKQLKSPYLADLETELKVRPGFFEGLLEEDDWSFVIKTCAFFQTLIAFTIAKQFNKPDLFPEFSMMPFGGETAGLISLAEKTGAIKSNSAKLLRHLAKIRNLLAHDIKFNSFNWVSYFQDLAPKDQKAFIKAFVYWKDEEGGPSMDQIRLGLSKSPQHVVYAGALMAVTEIYAATLEVDLQKAKDAQARHLLEEKMTNPNPLRAMIENAMKNNLK